MTSRIAIVGAGFSGSLLAVALSRAGFEVTIYEEHRNIGIPPHCTGIISRKTLSLINEVAGPLPPSVIAAKLKGLRACAYDRCVVINVEGGLIMLNRPRLDVLLAERAEKYGGSVNTGVRVENVSLDGRVSLRNGPDRKYDVVIIAEGPVPRLRKRLSIGLLSEPSYGVNYVTRSSVIGQELSTEVPPEEYAHVRFDPMYAPGYMWAIRVGSEYTIIGAASRRVESIGNLLKRVAGAIEWSYGGRLYLGEDPPSRISAGKVVVFGDAAGLVKPLSGGGLYPQALVADLFLRCISKKAEKNDRELVSCLTKGIRRVHARIGSSSRAARRLLENTQSMYNILEILKDKIIITEYDNHLKTAIELLLKNNFNISKLNYIKIKTFISLIIDITNNLRILFNIIKK